MAPERKNDFLDIASDDDSAASEYDSSEDLIKGGRSAKRRKVDDDDEDDVEQDEKPRLGDENLDAEEDKASSPGPDDTSKALDSAPDSRPETRFPELSRPLTMQNLVATEKAIQRSGVVYLSRIPPFMKPAKLRKLLEPFGRLNRIFLAPENPETYARRKRHGGNKKRSFTEGWVEFVDKDKAQLACEMLNARIIGGKKGSYYHDDMWNLLFLEDFKWHNLTEQIANENAERESRLMAEIRKTNKENKEFVKNVERSKMLDGMQAKAKKRKAPEPTQDTGRTFKQIPQIKKEGNGTIADQPEQVKRVLSKIF